MKGMKCSEKLNSFRRYLPMVFGGILILVGVVFLMSQIVDFHKPLEDFTTTTSQPSLSGKHVLWIYSYDSTYGSYDNMKTAIDEVFDPSEVSYQTIFLNSNHTDKAETQRVFEDQLSLMMQETKYDAILLSDDAATTFANTHYDEYFQDIPIVFFDMSNRLAGQRFGSRPMVTGQVEPNYVIENMQMAMKLEPDADALILIHDDSVPGLGYMNTIKLVAPSVPSLRFTYCDSESYSLDEFKKMLSSIPENTIVLTMSTLRFKDGSFYYVDKLAPVFGEYATVPVFQTSSLGVGYGITAGCYQSMKDAAQTAADVIIRILSGSDIQHMPMLDPQPPKFVADVNYLDKFQLDTSKLPEGTLLINQKTNFFYERKGILIPMAFIFAGFAVIMIAMSRQLGELRRNQASLQESKDSLQKSKDSLQYEMNHDHLTGLTSRQEAMRYFRENADSLIGSTMVLIDHDSFKEINETYGHDEGDHVIKEQAKRLKKFQRDGIYIARYGGDEFLVNIRNHAASPLDEDIYNLHHELTQQIRIGMDNIIPSVSLGMANVTAEVNPENAILDADLAVSKSKRTGGDQVVLFTPDLRKENEEEERMRTILLNAIKTNGFYMLFQPQVATTDGTLVGFEALVRIKDNVLSPGVFIPLAEKYGWIQKIARITTELTIKQMSRAAKAGLPPVHFSINYSSGQLSDIGYITFLKKTLKKSHVPASQLNIELTESMVMEKSRDADDLFEALHELGIGLHMDDFGTGYSSLSYLSYMPVDVIKLDKTLVDAFLVDGKDRFFVDLIQLIHGLGKKVLAEGVETKDQCDRLRRFGCDYIQGYYFSKPVPGDKVFEIIAAGKIVPA